jgi:histidine phosphotransferase ChpT
MDAIFGVRGVELLCSRLCHDLVSPVGAINNGVELIEEGGSGDSLGEALDLVAGSAQTAARRLALFRLALGSGAGGGVVPISAARDALDGWFAGGRVQLSWRPVLVTPPPGLLKLAMLAALVGEEAMPRGGSLTIAGGDAGLEILCSGTGCALREEALLVLRGELTEVELTPRGIMMHAALVIARFYGLAFTLSAELQPDMLTISIRQYG